MIENLHIFNDYTGYFTNKTARLITELDPDRNFYINTKFLCENKNNLIFYGSIKKALQNIEIDKIKLVFFHSYNYLNFEDIHRIKKANNNIKLIWIFWSHEYYQLPEFFNNLYTGYSRKFYFRKKISFHYNQFKEFLAGNIVTPFYIGLKSFKKTFKEFDIIASVIEDDFKIVTKGIDSIKYRHISYISLKDFPAINQNFEINKTKIMIGHSGSPILNHYDILLQLSQMGVSNDIYIPLAYGNSRYIKLIQKKIQLNIFNLNIEIQTKGLSSIEYYKKIDSIGYFILNSYCQQALGNIFFFLWNGVKVFLRECTSTYKTLKQKGFIVYNLDNGFDEKSFTPLTIEDKNKNKELTSTMLNDEKVEKEWLNLLRLE